VRRAIHATLALAALVAFLPTRASAHDVSYSYADLRWGRDKVELSVILHRDDVAPALGIATPESLMSAPFLARHADRVAALVTSRLHVSAAGELLSFQAERVEPRPDRHGVALTLQAPLRAPISRLDVQARLFPDNKQHETFLNVYDAADRIVAQEVLTAERARADVYARGPEGVLAVLATFIRAGIHHIFIGPDHILFIVGLLLLGGGVPRVLRVATAFTLAHSLTLGVAALGLVSVPGRIVEPLIAASIVYVGVENLRWRQGAPDWRTRIAFCFGLIHGFGFAGVLQEVGLPREALGWSLLAFNLGVEIGQACIILTVTPLLGALSSGWPRLAPRAVSAGSWVIILAGGFWFLQRIARL